MRSLRELTTLVRLNTWKTGSKGITPWWLESKRLDSEQWLRSRTSGIKRKIFFYRYTKKARSTSIEQIPTLSLLVVSTDLKQQRQGQTKSVKHNLKWDQVKFKSERGLQDAGSSSSSSSGSRSQSGVRNRSKSLRNAAGKRFYLDYSSNYNPSKRTCFKGVWDAQGNLHDL